MGLLHSRIPVNLGSAVRGLPCDPAGVTGSALAHPHYISHGLQTRDPRGVPSQLTPFGVSRGALITAYRRPFRTTGSAMTPPAVRTVAIFTQS